MNTSTVLTVFDIGLFVVGAGILLTSLGTRGPRAGYTGGSRRDRGGSGVNDGDGDGGGGGGNNGGGDEGRGDGRSGRIGRDEGSSGVFENTGIGNVLFKDIADDTCSEEGATWNGGWRRCGETGGLFDPGDDIRRTDSGVFEGNGEAIGVSARGLSCGFEGRSDSGWEEGVRGDGDDGDGDGGDGDGGDRDIEGDNSDEDFDDGNRSDEDDISS